MSNFHNFSLYFFYEKYNSVGFVMKNKLSQLLELEAFHFSYDYSWFPESARVCLCGWERGQKATIIVTYLIQFTVEISVFSTSASTCGLSPAEPEVTTVKQLGLTKLNKWFWAESNFLISQLLLGFIKCRLSNGFSLAKIRLLL